MNSRPEPRFWRLYRQLPMEIRQQARQAHRFWRNNPRHPSLQFKLIDPARNVYSIRITKSYRALGRLEDGVVIWFFIGTHDDYMQKLK